MARNKTAHQGSDIDMQGRFYSTSGSGVLALAEQVQDAGFEAESGDSLSDKFQSTINDYLKGKIKAAKDTADQIRVPVTDVQDVNSKSVVSNKIAKLTKASVGLGSVVNAGTDTAATKGSANYITSNGAYQAAQDALEAAKDYAAVTLAKDSTGLVYTVSQNGAEIGKINIPKDTFVRKAEVVQGMYDSDTKKFTAYDSLGQAGKLSAKWYLHLVIAVDDANSDGTTNDVYLDVTELGWDIAAYSGTALDLGGKSKGATVTIGTNGRTKTVKVDVNAGNGIQIDGDNKVAAKAVAPVAVDANGIKLSYNSTLKVSSSSLGVNVWDGTSAASATTLVSSSTLNSKLNAVQSYQEATMSGLHSLMSAGTLKKGATYKITDYVPQLVSDYTAVVHSGSGTSSISHSFKLKYNSAYPLNLYVTAISGNKIDPRGVLVGRSSTATYPSPYFECKVDFESANYDWIDSTKPLCTVYWMRDIYGNEAPYDFVGVLINKDGTESGGNSLFSTAGATYSNVKECRLTASLSSDGKYCVPAVQFDSANALSDIDVRGNGFTNRISSIGSAYNGTLVAGNKAGSVVSSTLYDLLSTLSSGAIDKDVEQIASEILK